MQNRRSLHKSPPEKEGFFCVAVIVSAHGIKGEVNLKVFTENALTAKSYNKLVNFSDKEFSLVKARKTVKGTLAIFDGIVTRNDSEALKGTYLYASLDNLDKLGDDEIYLRELNGMEVIFEDGEVIGKIHNVFDNGANTILEIISNQKEGEKEISKEVLLPYTDEIIVKIKKSANQLVVSGAAKEFVEL